MQDIDILGEDMDTAVDGMDLRTLISGGGDEGTRAAQTRFSEINEKNFQFGGQLCKSLNV